MSLDQVQATRIETVLPFLSEDGSLGLALIAFDGRRFDFLFSTEHGSGFLRDVAAQWDQMRGRESHQKH